MRIQRLLLMNVLLGAVLLAACGPASNSQVVAGLPTEFALADDLSRINQPVVIPSLTPLSPAQNSVAYGSVQINAQGLITTPQSAAASSPLLFSAQAVDPGTPPADVTPAATAVITAAATPAPAMANGPIAVPPIGDTTGGFVINAINTLCIPVINVLLTIIVGLVQAVWGAVGLQTNTFGQVLLCVLLPLGFGWYFLIRRRRRRR